jgi:hypothetical protein
VEAPLFSPVRADPNRAGFIAERISFRGTHFVVSIFLCLIPVPFLKICRIGITQGSLETFSFNRLWNASSVDPSTAPL